MNLMLVLLGLVVGVAAVVRDPIGQNLIVILADGYGATLLNNTKPNASFGIRHLAANGVQVDYVTPSFPTHTWPQWMSLSTGLYTENHGFTADYMWDRKTNFTFERGTGPNDTEDVWWDDAKAPLWYTAGKAGVDVHCYWFAHCHRVFYDMVVQVPEKRWANLDDPHQTDNLRDVFPEIVNRISKYQVYKQQMFLIRYANIGNAQKEHGPESDEVEQEVARFDLYINELQQKLEEANLFSSTNLVVMSDHGYTPLQKEEQFFMEQCLPDYSLVKKIVNSHSMIMVFTNPEDEGTVHYEFSVCEVWSPMGDYDENDTPFVKTYRMSELPEELHWKGSRFMSGVVLITKPGTSVVTKELPTVPHSGDPTIDAKQASGWEPTHDDMKGIFVARGPAFRENERFGPIEIVDVYQMLLNILSIEPAHPHNGTWGNVEHMLSEGWENRGPTENSSFRSSFTLFCFISVLLHYFF
ncbi:hypothetical protein B9Z55_023018 [Caenorhabditis nigoni]|uniref:Ectonucleotide pyrophosphatase/phosphodiesterase family member 4 n=2 Tax=Caenorhabditis nigoni TaxID=1611254 RepID=A0A2G5SN76_9PELO|nr:hypothetical protein B9Z55_023018 [Caenorhabditis nigoni]